MLIDSGKQIETDKKFDDDVYGTYSNHLFVRLIAKNKKFSSVDFKYTVFDSCYLRECRFDSCDFTGARFVGSNLHGSKFSGCNFGYAVFERTQIDPTILDTECPPLENLKARFARTLRTNFQQLGDANAVNKAILVELQSTEVHLRKAWGSNESYYRKKYKGIDRLKLFVEWLSFVSLDFMWGNGESPLRLLRFAFLIILIMSTYDTYLCGNTDLVSSYIQSIPRAGAVFVGTLTPEEYSKGYLAIITLIRLVVVGFLLSIILKKFNRR